MTTARDRYRTKLYRNGASQAVRIPKALAWPEDIEVELVRQGDAVIVRPVTRPLSGLGRALRQMGEGMERFERDPGEGQERDWAGAAGEAGEGAAEREMLRK